MARWEACYVLRATCCVLRGWSDERCSVFASVDHNALFDKRIDHYVGLQLAEDLPLDSEASTYMCPSDSEDTFYVNDCSVCAEVRDFGNVTNVFVDENNMTVVDANVVRIESPAIVSVAHRLSAAS